MASDNPYLPLLYAELERVGIDAFDASLQPWRLHRTIERADLVHLHWPEYVLGRTGTDPYSRSRSVAGAVALVQAVRRLSASGIPTVWTVHNRRPHASNVPNVHRWLYRRLARECAALIVHSEGARLIVERDLQPARRIHVIAHGSYGDHYPLVDRADARRELDLPAEAPVILSFGAIAEYKQVVQLVDLFRRNAESDWVLIVAGKPRTVEIERALVEVAEGDRRIRLRPAFIDEPEVGRLFGAADMCCFNYRDLFSSGALMLAHTQGCPALIRRTGLAWELPSSPAVQTFADDDFAASVRSVLAVPLAHRQRVAFEMARAKPWSEAADAHAAVFSAVLESTPRTTI